MRKKRRREAWISALKRKDMTELKLKYQMICAKHFIQGKPAKLEDEDSPDWIPTKNMGYKRPAANFERYARRKHRKTETVIDAEISLDVATDMVDNAMLTPALDCSVQNKKSTSSTSCEDIADDTVTDSNVISPCCAQIHIALRNANSELYHLREQLSYYKLDRAYFEKHEYMCTFFTGLSYDIVKALYELVEPHIKTTHSNILTKFQQLILTLMKLRLNLLFTDLGHRFRISRVTCSRIFFNVLYILHKSLNTFIYCLQSTLPKCFLENFGEKKVTVIIDCFEIFVERPKNKQASSQHFSQYKHHNTVKYLIGISPQGHIMFISEGFSGRASDKFVTENSGFLNNLIPGDLILADRGFNITDSVNLYMAEVQTPSFLNGQKQLLPKEVEKTRKIANVRIHVERVIGLLRRKYTIAAGRIPVHMLRKKQNGVPVMDKILRVCCAVINCSPSVVPQ